MSGYDFIIAGGGAAGLGLAYELSLSSLRGKKTLVIERDAKDRNDRTWCFWTDQPTRLDHLVYRSWDQVEVVNDNFHEKYDLRPYQYRMLRSIDYYQGIREALLEVPGLAFRQARVSEINETRDKRGAEVTVNNEPLYARWAFDSLYKPTEYAGISNRYHDLKQHFKGWEIETPVDSFDPNTVTLFDFRTPQKGAMRFFYILPFTKRRALVEYTLFSANLLKPHEYDRAIAEYLENARKITRYRTISTETGVIPMTDYPFPRKLGEHIMAIGTKGGRVKPSSGYAFMRIQQDAGAIVRSLLDFGNPFQVPVSPVRYRLFDSLMLQVMHRKGSQMAQIFTQLFHRNSPQEIFRFLDETATLPENIRLLATLPRSPFIIALLKVKLLRRV